MSKLPTPELLETLLEAEQSLPIAGGQMPRQESFGPITQAQSPSPSPENFALEYSSQSSEATPERTAQVKRRFSELPKNESSAESEESRPPTPNQELHALHQELSARKSGRLQKSTSNLRTIVPETPPTQKTQHTPKTQRVLETPPSKIKAKQVSKAQKTTTEKRK